MRGHCSITLSVKRDTRIKRENAMSEKGSIDGTEAYLLKGGREEEIASIST